jgi:hypothetical protein
MVDMNVRDALSVKCPRCGKPIGVMCVYTAPVSPYYTTEELRKWGSYAEVFARLGQPCKRAHNERLAVVYRRWEVLEREKERKAALARAIPSAATQDLIQVWTLEKEFDRREQDRLFLWLRMHGTVLMQSPKLRPAMYDMEPWPW